MSRGGPRPTAFLVLAAAALAGCERSNAPAAAPASGDRHGGIAVACAPSLPQLLDPFVSPDQMAADLRLLLFTPLVLYDTAAGFVPHLASAWHWSDDGRSLTFDLRTGVTWHDGTPLTASDVAWTLGIARDTAYAYWAGQDFADVRSITTPDSTHVQLTYGRPPVSGLEPYAALPILPRHLLDTIPAARFARADFQRAPVGSGPFRFGGRTPEGYLEFDRYDAYPEALGGALLDRIVMRAVPESSTLLIELQTGNVDVCLGSASLAPDVQRNTDLHALAVEPVAVHLVALDTRKPPLQDARVRRAISAALRRQDIAATVSPLARPARTFLPVGSQWTDATLEQPDADSTLAVALLDSAGWSRTGADGIRRNDQGQPLQFTIVAPQQFQTELTVVQAQLRRVGIDAQLRFLEGSAFVGIIQNPATRPTAMAIGITPDKYLAPDPYYELHSGTDSNLASYRNASVDSAIDALEATADTTRRRTLYRELQDRVAEDVPYVYTIYLPRLLAVGPRLQDVRADRNGPFASVTSWWIPANRRR